jgi:predicted DNA-binding transcriptional regulator YafY
MNDAGLSKAQKFVRLFEWLQLPSGVSVQHVLGELDLDDRTLRRYLADLRELGLPILDEGRGPTRSLRLDPVYRRRGVELTLLEAVSMRFGRTLFNFLGGTQFASDLDDALERLSPFIRRADQERIKDIDKKIIAVPEHAKDYEDMGELLDEVLTALLYQNPATAVYARPSGEPKHVALHPYTLVSYRQGLYLFALDLEADKVKTYAIDRFQRFDRRRTERFDVPDDYEPEALLDDCFGIISGPVHTIELRFAPKVAPYIRERIWHQSQTVHDDPNGSVVLTMTVGLGTELTQWILGFGPDVKVIRPRSLATEVRTLHREACR